MKIALICIAKNEDNYIQEWIDYNLKLGFDDIFIYQNDWRCSIEHPNVKKIEFDGVARQVPAYKDFIDKNHSNYDWAAFFDVDEFLVLKKHNNIKEFISDYSDCPSIGINWVMFGDNGLKTVDGEYSVLKRFTKRQIQPQTHIKSIVKLSSDLKMTVHNPMNYWFDTDRNKNSGPHNKNRLDNVAQLNHYFGKTIEEFHQKSNRGKADCTPISCSPEFAKRTIKDFNYFNVNEIDDFSARDFFYKY
jgi:hypothetical protein